MTELWQFGWISIKWKINLENTIDFTPHSSTICSLLTSQLFEHPLSSAECLKNDESLSVGAARWHHFRQNFMKKDAYLQNQYHGFYKGNTVTWIYTLKLGSWGDKWRLASNNDKPLDAWMSSRKWKCWLLFSVSLETTIIKVGNLHTKWPEDGSSFMQFCTLWHSFFSCTYNIFIILPVSPRGRLKKRFGALITMEAKLSFL